MNDFLPIPAVSLIEGRPATTSLAIAEHFGKRHDDVVKSIRNLCANCPEEFNARNFAAVEYIDAKGEKRPMFIVFFDGFILLAMSYKGKKALDMKIAYITAFNAMLEKLGRNNFPSALEPQEERKRRQKEQEQLALPPAPKPYREKCAEVIAEMAALRGQFFRVSENMMFTFIEPFWDTGFSPVPDHMKPFADAMRTAIQSFWTAMSKDFATVEELYSAYVDAEKMLNR